jgi:hypothetical protein
MVVENSIGSFATLLEVYKRLLWEKMRAYFYAYALESMRHLFEALYYGLNKSAPTLASDSG